MRQIAAPFLLLLLSQAARLSAQVADGAVLAPGQLRIEGEVQNWHSDTRFGSGGRESLGAGFDGLLIPASFFPLVPVAQSLTAVLEATEGVPGASPVDPAELSAGTLEMDLVATSRVAP